MKTPKLLSQDLPLKLVALVILIAILWWPVSQAIPGDWKGQIVDKETGKPLEGVVVLAVWRKCDFIVVHGCPAYYDAEEVVTGPDGRFRIQPRRYLGIFPPLQPLKGPELYIFKAGYGQWEFQGYDTWGKDAIVRREHFEKLWKQFRREGVVLELPPLKTQKERLAFLSLAHLADALDIPPARMRRYFEAIDREAMELGRAPVEPLEMKQREREEIWKEYREKPGTQR